MAAPGLRVLCPKVISFDGLFEDTITMAVDDIGCDITINPTSSGSTSIKLIGKSAKNLKNQKAHILGMVKTTLRELNISENLNVELQSRTTPTEEEFLAGLFTGIWSIYANPDWEESATIKQIINKVPSRDFRKQIFYTALKGGLRINQFPLQEDGFRIDLPEGFTCALYSNDLKSPCTLKPAGQKTGEKTGMARTAALVIGSLYRDILRIKFALSDEVDNTTLPETKGKLEVIGSGADLSNYMGKFSGCASYKMNYAIFKNSKEAEDYTLEIQKMNQDIRKDQILISTKISRQGTFIH